MADKDSFCHGFINAKAVESLFVVIKEKLSHGHPPEKIAELNKLWQKALQCNDSITANSCCQALLQLIKSNSIKVEDAIDNIVNLSASAKSTKWLVHLTVKFLTLQFDMALKSCENQNQLNWNSSYKLHCHTHPFIFIVNSSPQSWTYLLIELEALITNYDVQHMSNVKFWNSSFIINIFKPFFLHILLNPSVDNSSLHRKSSLLSILTKILNTNATATAIKFFLDVLLHLKAMDFHIRLYNEILEWTGSSNTLINVVDAQFISTLSFSVLSSCYSSNQNPSAAPLTSILHKILQIIPDIEPVGVMAIGLSNLLCRASSEALMSLLQCVVDILKFPNWFSYPKPVQLACFLSLKASILQLLLHKQYLGFCGLASHLNKALIEVQMVCKSIVGKAESIYPETKSYEFHDAWLSDIIVLLKSVEASRSLLASRYILLLKSYENMLLNIGLLICGGVISSTMSTAALITYEEYAQYIDILLGIVSSAPQLTLTILPTILYAIENEQDINKQKLLCSSLPSLAVDNNCMPFVIGIIQTMSQVSSLRSFAINLMLNLWKKQERCFPYLQQMLSQTMVMTPKVKTEVITITSIALKDICKSQSVKYTSELLAMISLMLKKRLHPTQVFLLLDGIYALLEKEVLNVRSMWPELMETLSSYKCDTVTKAMLKITSLVPKFEVDLPEFVQFKSDVLSWIWSLLETSTTIVKGDALVCLAHFKHEDFILKYLPLMLRPEMPEEIVEEEFLLQAIPGQLLVNLMISVPSSTQLQYFCSSLLSQELQNLPRDIKDRAFRAQKQAVRGNVFSDFSNFILHMHERNKQPNLKGHFATSVLMCYNPLFDDSPKNLVSSGRSALQLLQALLCEVTVDAKNWKGLLWIIQGWKHFMQLCLQIMIKGRATELNLQLKQKNCDKDDVQHKLNTVEFWCRDKITDILKSSSKGTPTMQGNSLLALSGMICALKFIMTRSQEANTENDKSDKEGSGYLSHNHWMGMATDTIITTADSKYKSSGRIFSWCQYKAVSRAGRLTTSKFGEVCALQALKMFIPALLPHDMDRILSILLLLANRVIKEDSVRSENETPMTVLHLNLTLGSIIAELFNGKVHETSNPALREKINFIVSTLLRNAQNCLCSKSGSSDDEFSSDEDSDDDIMVSSLLGVGMILPVLFSCGKTSFKEDANKIFNSLVKYADELEDKSGGFLEAFYFTLVGACIAGKATRSITADVACSILTKLYEEFLENRNIPISVAVSHLCYDLCGDSEKQALDLFPVLYDKFLKEGSNEKLPTRQKLTSLNGLVALTGSESLFGGVVSELTQETESNISKVTKLLKQYAQHGKDVGITSNSILLLGRLYLALHTSNTRQNSSMPQTFSYLPETSILRPVFSAILNFSMNDSASIQLAKSFVLSISDAVSHVTKPLPPVDLLDPLSRLQQLHLNETELTACFQLALTQVSENETATMFLDTCIEPTKFLSFHFSSQCFLLKSLHVLILHLSSANILSYLSLIQCQFFIEKRPMFHQALLQGILSSLKLSSLPQDVPASLFTFAIKVIREYKFSLSDDHLLEHWKLIADIVAEDPNNKILSSLSDNEFYVRILFVKCHLVCQGLQPIQWLNDSIEQCAQSKNSEIQRECLWIVFVFLRKRFMMSKSTAMLTWLQEMIAILMKLGGNQLRDLFWLKSFAVGIMILANRGPLKILKKGNNN